MGNKSRVERGLSQLTGPPRMGNVRPASGSPPSHTIRQVVAAASVRLGLGLGLGLGSSREGCLSTHRPAQDG